MALSRERIHRWYRMGIHMDHAKARVFQRRPQDWAS